MTTVKLRASCTDAPLVEASLAAVQLSGTLATLLAERGDPDGEIHIHNVKHATLVKAMAYCEYHAHHGDADSGTWDAAYCPVDQVALFDLILAAHNLDIKGLLKLTCETVAGMIRGKTPEEIRRLFSITNDFTPAEEEAVRRENAWCEM